MYRASSAGQENLSPDASNPNPNPNPDPNPNPNPNPAGAPETICRPEWGEPTLIGAPRRGAQPAAKRRRADD